jgi:hypothetical protein
MIRILAETPEISSRAGPDDLLAVEALRSFHDRINLTDKVFGKRRRLFNKPHMLS